MEREIELGLEAGLLVGCLAGQAHLRRRVQEDRQVGPEAVGRDRLEVPEPVQRQAGPVALVGQGRVREPGTDHRPAGLERRPDDLDDQLAPGGIEEQGIGERVDRLRRPATRQEQMPDLLAEPRPAGLAGLDDLEAPGAEPLGQPRRLRGLADTLGPFDGDEPATSVAHGSA